jgi:menaquinol-cytochrome c reductase cytochrome b/c subunit
MARDESQIDKETFDRVLAEELSKGTDRRIAEGRARSAAVKAFRKAHGIEPAPPRQAGAASPAAAGAAASGNGGGDGEAPVAATVGAGTAAAAPSALRTAPAPTGRPPSAKPGTPEKQRLLALVQPEGIQRVQREQGDRVNVFPHLLIEEFVAMFIVLVFLVIYSTIVDAPLRELANPNLTPNPSKAPWYFLGLQELLRYFHPMIAGVVFPTLILVGLAAIPYIDRNPSTRPGDRKLIILLFTMLFMFGATLTIIGSFFRGEGFNWVWPWSQGLFFEL